MKKFLLFLSGGMIFMIAAFFLLNSYVGAMVNYSLQSQASAHSTAKDSDLFSIKIANAQVGTNVKDPSCLDNYQSWPSSTTFKSDAPWSVSFAWAPETSYSYFNNFEHDINGDGLADYVYFYRALSIAPYGAYAHKACVYLSNGSGWTKAYQCYVSHGTNPPVFYGDCAQT